MSISMERFASNGQFATLATNSLPSQPVPLFRMQCHCCGFEPEDTVVPPRICPKCHSQAWERFARPHSILDNAERNVA
jgi:Zn finger protein HypA/HybF involved in hydrogenase expression